VCCSVLQCVAVCCSVLQCLAVCCNALQCVAVCCNVLQCVAMCCSVLQCVAVLQRVTWLVLQRTAPISSIQSCHIHAYMMSHMWTSHVTHVNESCHTYERVMTHMWMSRVASMNESCLIYECVMSLCDMNTSCHTHVNESCHTHVNESCHTQEVLQQEVMSHILVCSWKIDVWTAGRSFDLLREDSDNDVCPKQLTKFILSKDVVWPTLSPRVLKKRLLSHLVPRTPSWSL